MNILIYGAGAIGCHIGYCLYEAGHHVKLICRGQHFEQMKQHGMHIKICDNEVVVLEKTIEGNDRLEIIDNLEDVKGTDFDFAFITVKLMDYNSDTLRTLSPYLGEHTAVIPPCTKLPFWWFYNLQGTANQKYKDTEFDMDLSKHFIKTNLICMTMWISAVLESPGHTVVKHVQRGYPLGAVYPQMDHHADILREVFEQYCLSPVVEDIRSEIFIKSINSFAFNMVAINTEFNNLQFSQNQAAKDSVSKIMLEGDQILQAMDIPIIQSVESRITQTLSSTKHTLSMLHDFKNGKPVELKFLWDGFDKISRILGTDMPNTRETYDRVMAKVAASGQAI